MSRWPVDPAQLLVGGLDAEERVDAERLVREDPEFRADVERLRCTSAALAATRPTARLEPPSLDLPAARAARPTAGVGRSGPARGRVDRRAFTLRPALALACAAVLLIAGGIGGAMLTGDVEPAVDGDRVVALAPLGEAEVRRAAVRLGADAAGFVADGLPANRGGEHYELWLLNSPDDLVSVGTFRVGPDGRADVRFSIGVDPSRFAFLDVSVEPDDGDPGHSTRSVLRSEDLRVEAS